MHAQKRLLAKLVVWLWGGLLACLLQWASASACTAWLAAGDSVEGGGTLIAKNRDWRTGDIMAVKLVQGNDGYKYFILFGYNAPGNKGGINSAGLAAFSLSAPRPFKAPASAKHRIVFGIDWILTHYDSVDACLDALRQGQWRLHPMQIALADAHKVALVEIGPKGRYAVQETANGVLWHANLYQDASLQDLNPPSTLPGEAASSGVSAKDAPRTQSHGIERMQLAHRQMHSRPRFTAADILAFAQDPIVCYALPNKRTYATFLVHHRPDAPAELVIRLYTPGEATREGRFTLEQAMSGEGLRLLH